MRVTRIIALLFMVILIPVFSSSAFAGWEVTYLHPAGSTQSQAQGVSAGQQAGSAYVGGIPHAVLWSSTAESWLDLEPAGYDSSIARGISGGQQAGVAYTGGAVHAGLWNGTAGSFLDLHPAGHESSEANAVSGGKQVGYVDSHAALWSGTAEGWVDLHPGGAYSTSSAFGAGDGQQVGYANDGMQRACLWSGTAGSWVDLHPSGYGYASSIARGVAGGWQVGDAVASGGAVTVTAGLWNGTAASWVSLNPSGCFESHAYGVSAGWQVGLAAGSPTGDYYHASLWNGTAESWFDLHDLLNPAYTHSSAQSICVSGDDIWIAGAAYNSATSYNEAVLWHNVIPEPSSLLILGSGLLGLAGLVRRKR